MLVGNAFVWSGSASEKGTLVQRRRWEGGFLSTALRQGPKEAWHGLRRGKPRAILAGLDLMIPPLALFAVLNMAVLAAAAALLLAFGGAWWPVIAQLVLLLLAMIACSSPGFARGANSSRSECLARLPLYVIWKLPMYLGLARRGHSKGMAAHRPLIAQPWASATTMAMPIAIADSRIASLRPKLIRAPRP